MKADHFSFALFFQIFLILLLLGAVYFCFRNKSATRVYWHFAKNIGALFIFFEILTFLIQGITVKVSIIVPLHFFSIVFSVMGGMVLTRRLERPGLPIIMHFSKPNKKPLSKNFWGYLRVVLIYSTVICSFTFVLFKTTHPEVSDLIRRASEYNLSGQNKIYFSSIIFFILIAFYEEIIFRLFIQNFFIYLFRKWFLAIPISITLCSLIFAIGHYGVLETWWVKLFQTFVIGLILGRAMLKYGMETSFAIHAIFNIFALYSARFLIR